MRTEEAPPIRLEDYRPPDWLVDRVELDIALDPVATRVRSTLKVRPNENGSAPAPLSLDGESLILSSIALDGDPLAPEHFVATAERLTIAQPPPRPFQLTIETVVNPSANTQLLGLYRSGRMYCTQCEAEGFRRITYFPDRPDVMAVYTVRLEANRAEAPILLANGNLIASGDVADGNRHFAIWHDPYPKPSYLFAVVGGNLACAEDRFRTRSGREVVLRIYVEPAKESRCGYAMDSLKRAMRWDETAFGREYDLDVFMIVAVSDFNMGAMENKGLNIFNDKYVLASPETATDADFERIEAIIAHEYFHNWTGNRITCRDWFQLCLKEGLTVFRDQEFSAETRSRPVERISDVRGLRAHQFEEDAGPLAHPVRSSAYREINNFYTATVYEKGAEVVRMLTTLLGPEKFREGMDVYFNRHDGEAATVEQFVQCFADVSGADLRQFMLWYSQAGTPEVVVSTTFDERAKTFRLELAQTVPATPGQPSKEPMVIPLAMGLLGTDGGDLPLKFSNGRPPERNVLILRQSAETFVFCDIAERPVLSLNRGFSAPVKLNANVSAADLQFLAAHDTDAFNRWDALQKLSTTVLVENVSLLRGGASGRTDEGVLTAFQAVLTHRGHDPAFVALMLTVPTEADIAREIGHDVDPDFIFAARVALRRALGARLSPELFDHYRRLSESGPYRPDAESAGRRALRSTCLDLLAASGGDDALDMAAQQYERADNMTDRMAALSTLCMHDKRRRAGALDDFYARYADEPLIIDKWFTLQAAIPEPETLDRVKALTGHRAFSFSNPNRVRALIHCFAMANQKEFNRADGAGYNFIADIVLALDAKNPQLAARLLATFKSWRGLEPTRRALAEAALRRVAAIAALSRDVSDIVGRTLA
jgi:aminopeptidase N